jgi:hypothetical protein
VHAGGLDADDERGGDLAVGEAARDDCQHFRLTRRQSEGVLQAVLRFGRGGVLGRRIEPRSLGQQLEFVQEGVRSDRAAMRAVAARSRPPP